MTGTPANASVWAYADVYIAPIGTAIPADVSTPFSGSWNLLGLLDGSDGFEETRSVDKKDHYAWGGTLVTTSRKNFKLEKKFSILEDNTYTRSLIWPGSSASSIVVPTPVPMLIAFETRTGGKVQRLITANYALIDVDGGIKDGEEDLTKRTMVATIFPTSANPGVLFTRQAVPDIASIAITPLTLALSLAGAKIKTLVATATYTDASTGVITDQANWTTSDAAKATVSHGFVTGIATGTANVSCNYGGVTATAPCVVTVSA